MSNSLLALALLAALAALGVSLWALRHAPQRLLHEALVELADQRAILERLLTRSHNEARASNVAAARDAKRTKGELLQQAQEVIAQAAAQQPLRAVKPPSEEQQLAELRRKAGIL